MKRESRLRTSVAAIIRFLEAYVIFLSRFSHNLGVKRKEQEQKEQQQKEQEQKEQEQKEQEGGATLKRMIVGAVFSEERRKIVNPIRFLA